MALLAEKGVFTMSILKVRDVMAICECTQSTVVTWIKKGYLPAKPLNPGKYRSAYTIEEEDLKAFMASDHYKGHPEDIRKSRPFTRVPMLEECYPINLLLAVMEIPMDSEEVAWDIWDYDIRQFKYLITLLKDREQKVIQMRYQLGMTLDEVAIAFDLGRERIRQIQMKAQRKLKGWSLKKGIRVVDRQKYEELRDEKRHLMAEYDKLLSKYEVLCRSCDKVVPDELPVVEINRLTLEELDLSVRSYNCLKRAGLQTLKDILDFDENQQNVDNPYGHTWMTIRNLGKKSVMEIAKKVFDYCRYRIRYYDVANKKYAGEIPIYPGESLLVGSVYFHCGEERK